MAYSDMARIVIEALSADSRKTITELAHLAGCSRVTAARLIDRLTAEMGLKFTLELDENALRLQERHITAIKLGKPYKEKDLKAMFSEDPYIHNAYICKGDFDLILHTVAENPMKYLAWENHMATLLSEYEPEIKPSEFVFAQFGYLPLQTSIINSANLDINEKDKKLLSLLNDNSRLSYTDISKATGIESETLRYRLFKLKSSGIIKRFTIAAQKPHRDYALAYFSNYKFNKSTRSSASRARLEYLNADSGKGILNTYQFMAPISGSFRFFTIALFDDEQSAYEKAISRHVRAFGKENVSIYKARITGAIKGLLPFRRLDIKKNYIVVPV